MRLSIGAFVAFFALPLLSPGRVLAYTYVHEVLPGERISRIAKRYRISVKKLKRMNRLRGNRLRAGRKLRIVSSVPVRIRRKVPYIVKKGDSLSRIAKRFKLRVRMLRRLNARILRRRALKPGMKFWVIAEGRVPMGHVKGLYQLESGPGFKVRNGARAWGSFLAITTIADVMASYARRYAKAMPMLIYDLSRKGGGYFKPHKSHRAGRDVDIPYVLKKRFKAWSRAHASTIEPARSWFLVRSFLQTKKVKYIFMEYPLQRVLYKYAMKTKVSKTWLKKVFQYPRGRHAGKAIIRHEPGHDTHFHVRFVREKKTKPNS